MDNEIKILLRKPKFPVLLKDGKNIFAFKVLSKLCKKLIEYNQLDDGELIIIDSALEEFWFMNKEQKKILAPGFFLNKITKKDIVSLYNQTGAGIKNPYQKNLSNVKIVELMKEICDLLTAKK